jgi:hypothetical protein
LVDKGEVTKEHECFPPYAMNEQTPASVPLESTALPYHDRSTGLMVFGILTILLGALAGLLAVVTVLSLAVASAVPNAQISLSSALPGVCVYVGLSVVLIWLGIGSIKARRWARALLLIFSWSWLIAGILDVGVLLYILPKVLANLPTPEGANHPPVSAAAMTTIMIFTILFSGFFLVVLPAIWTFFYQSRHVKLTCEWRDPVVRWTDACPLPVLGLCLWLGLSAFTVIAMNAMPYIAVPFFGMFLSGMAARAVYLVLGAFWLYAAWQLYLLDSRGWWLALAGWLVFMISAVITYSQHDVMEMYRLMHYSEAQLAQLKQTGLFQGNMMAWFTPICMAPLLGYMFFIKRYLR